jgi:hypothetical protein
LGFARGKNQKQVSGGNVVIKNPIGPRNPEWAQLSESQKASILERYFREIEYCKNNLGKDFKEVDLQRMGYDESYKGIVDRITDGLIAFKYVRYGDVYKGAKYFYREWSEYKVCRALNKKPCSIDGPGDYNALAQLIAELEREHAYYEALKYYPEYIEDLAGNFPGETVSEKKEAMNSHIKEAGGSDIYVQAIRDYQNAKRLVALESPSPLAPAVQNHELFYSDKTAEVVKSLEYYDKHKVRFMIEKAAKDKRPAISKKAKEYLDSWDNQGVQNRDEESAAGKK